MSVEFSFQNNFLSITKPVIKKVEFEYIIYQVELVKGMLIVILKNSEEYKNKRNVYGVNLKGEIVWQIDDPNTGMAYSNLYWENSDFYVGNYTGLEFNIDAKTGKVIKTVLKK